MKTCSKCSAPKPVEAFGIDRRSGKPMPQCKKCRAQKAREWRSKKPGYEKGRYQRVKVRTRERHLVRKYGVTLAAYDAMLRRQGGKCAICHAPESEQHKGVFHVDHCHATGTVRGLLCRGCNHMLGAVRDDAATLQRAIDYIRVPQVAAAFIQAYTESLTP